VKVCAAWRSFFGCFQISEYGSWIAVTIYANHAAGYGRQEPFLSRR